MSSDVEHRAEGRALEKIVVIVANRILNKSAKLFNYFNAVSSENFCHVQIKMGYITLPVSMPPVVHLAPYKAIHCVQVGPFRIYRVSQERAF